ncbi:MAG: carboxylate-amine ligase [Geminicoccaceae bacterium]|nr:carboxylate-amine ligase [Geminicoccaceae bacterium]
MAARKPLLTLGVEEEYLIVDLETRLLATEQPAGFMDRCREALGDQVTHELLQAQVEIGTSVCRNVDQIRKELAGLRRTVSDCAREYGYGLIAASTHPSASWRDQKSVDMERYRLLSQDFQAIARRLVICGMHVHAGIDDDDLRIDLMNQAAYFLPHLLALSTSSPFWEGNDTGMKAFRPTIFGDLPRTGLPEEFQSYSDWLDLLRMMERTGVVDDPTKIWWDMRPSVKQPTLEMRVCDVCTRLEDAITIVAVYQSLLAFLFEQRAGNRTWRRYRQILLEENKWRAQRYGVSGTLADYGRCELVPMADLMEELKNLLRPHADDLGCLAELERVSGILSNGTSADRQLAVYYAAIESGADEHAARLAVVDWLLEESLEGVPA